MKARSFVSENGQILVMALGLLLLGSVLILGFFRMALVVDGKIRLQTAADLAVLSVLDLEANGLNALALGNRAVLAQDALAAQLNALVSESAFYADLAERFSWLVSWVPSLGVGAAWLSRGARMVERATQTAARWGIPLVSVCDTALSQENEALRLSLPLLALKAARLSAETTAPGSSIHPGAQSLLLRQALGLSSSLRNLPEDEGRKLRDATLDSHTRKRGWHLGRGVFSFPIRTDGGTKSESADFFSRDRMQFKTWKGGHLRWRTVLSSSSRASDFRYRGHGRLLTMKKKPGRVNLLLEKALPSDPLFQKPVTLRAVATGELFFRRDRKPSEPANLFNPFWRSRLIPSGRDGGGRFLVALSLAQEAQP